MQRHFAAQVLLHVHSMRNCKARRPFFDPRSFDELGPHPLDLVTASKDSYLISVQYGIGAEGRNYLGRSELIN